MEPLKKVLRKLPAWMLALLITGLGLLIANIQQVQNETTQPTTQEAPPSASTTP